MFGPMRKALAALCTAALLFGAGALPVRSEDSGPAIDFLSYEEALTYFDFDHAANNWCGKFGLDPVTQLEEAKRELLSGTDPRLIIGLATLARDTGHAAEKLVVNTAFRPACYQETLGLHDANINTGPYRNYMSWNGRNVVKFWWTAEQAQGWPDAYRIDLSAYDIPSMDVSVFYRAALRLWDNGWVSGYYARPGCSSHNSGTALDVSNYWIGGTFDTAFTHNGVTYRMEDLSNLDAVIDRFSKNKKRQLQKAMSLHAERGMEIEDFYRFHSQCLAAKKRKISYSREFLLVLERKAKRLGQCEVLSIRNADGVPYAAAFLVWDKKYMYYLIPAINPAFGESGAGALLVLEALKMAREKHVLFDFEGSMERGTAKHYKQFGSTPFTYYSVEKYYKPFFRIAMWIQKLREWGMH